MAGLAAGGGCSRYEVESDDGVFRAAVAVFAKLKVLRPQRATRGVRAERRAAGGQGH